jgi:hypothetical protein
MDEPQLVFSSDGQVVVNFGVFAGRDVTQAEIERLGDTLLEEFPSFEIVSENRMGFTADHRAALHRVRVELQDGATPGDIMPLVKDWAQDCLTERQAVQP